MSDYTLPSLYTRQPHSLTTCLPLKKISIRYKSVISCLHSCNFKGSVFDSASLGEVIQVTGVQQHNHIVGN